MPSAGGATDRGHQPRMVAAMRSITALAVATALVLAGCGGDGDASTTTTTTTAASAVTTTTTTTTTPATTTSSAPDGSTTTATTEPPGSDPAPAPEDLPGEPFDLFPYEGAALGVVGVDRDDVLNVRVGPGTNFTIGSELEPTATGFVATGRNRRVDDQIWAEIDVDGTTGWVNARYVLQPGSVTDITAELDPGLGGETMLDLGRAVADTQASTEPASRIVVVDGPEVGDLGEVTVDVIGLGDDSLGGVRLHVFGAPAAGGEAFVLRTVEQTLLCSRGVTGDGLCT